MTKETSQPDPPAGYVAPSPHIFDKSLSTRGMMADVIVGLTPVLLVSLAVFGWYAVVQVGLCVLTCLATEAALALLAGRRVPIGDCSVAVTGVILGLSLPWSAPWYVPVIGSVVAVGVGKAVFGGVGFNLFNPAMVGRAFVMLSFAGVMGAPAYRAPDAELQVITQATPLAAAKGLGNTLLAGESLSDEDQQRRTEISRLGPLLHGNVNGSLGETSAIAALLGGIFLCIRRSAAWEIPAGMLLGALVSAWLADLANLTALGPLQHLTSGALLLGAFFIATDPVTSPLTIRGKFIFGLLVGLCAILIRVLSGYPEGVMFAVLLGNAATPLINRWTVPQPLGGPVPQPS